MSAPDGLVVVDKAGAMTSHDVVARARRLLSTRKIGHAGTLDPMATGVLVLGVGRATRLLGHLQLSDKTYDATVRLGVTTTTDDREGEVVATAPVDALTEEQVRSALAGFVGEIDQVPSAVSAIKVDGRRAYDRVRAGEQVELAARRVTVHDLAVRDVRRTVSDAAADPATTQREVLDVDVTLHCSTGTYVRAVARDLGEQLGTGGHLTALRRTTVGSFDLGVARTLEQLGADPTVLPIAEAARRAFASRDLDEEQAADVRVGRKLELDLGRTGPVAVFAPDGTFLALYEQAGERARAVAVFV